MYGLDKIQWNYGELPPSHRNCFRLYWGPEIFITQHAGRCCFFFVYIIRIVGILSEVKERWNLEYEICKKWTFGRSMTFWAKVLTPEFHLRKLGAWDFGGILVEVLPCQHISSPFLEPERVDFDPDFPRDGSKKRWIFVVGGVVRTLLNSCKAKMQCLWSFCI